MNHIACFDFDSTVVTKESLDEVIAHALAKDPNRAAIVADIESITARGMNGELSFLDSVQARLAAVALHKKDFETVGDALTQHITPGMQTLFALLHEKHVPTFIVSGGFRESILPTAQVLGVPETNVYTNECIYAANGSVTGANTNTLLWTNNGKAPVITYIAAQYPTPHSILIGDGANDLAAYNSGAVDAFCGFGANAVRPKVQKEAPVFAHTTEELQQWLSHTLNI